MQVSQIVIIQALDNIFKGRKAIFRQGNSCTAMVHWIQPCSNLACRNDRKDCFQGLKIEPGPVFNGTSILIGSSVSGIAEELVEQVTVG